MTDSLFHPDTEFFRALSNAPLTYYEGEEGYTDIDGDGTGDIKLRISSGSSSIKTQAINNWFKIKEDGSTQYTQYSYYGQGYSNDSGMVNEPWKNGGTYNEDIFDFYDNYAADTAAYNSWTTTFNSRNENTVFYFANADKSVVTRLIANDISSGEGTFDSWTTTPQQQEDSSSNPAIDFNYKLTREGSNETLESLAVLGQGVDAASLYNLEITASSLLDGYDIESTDITLKFNPTIFNNVSNSDVKIGTELPIKNSVEINNEQGTIRIAAANLAHLNQGGFVTNDTVLASFTLDFDESSLSSVGTKEDGSLEVSPLVFDIDVNNNETILSRTYDDGSNFGNREIKSLHELGAGIQVGGTDVKLYEAGIRITELDDGLVLGTNRIIGSNQGFTNLIRSGDTVEATTTWLNSGNTDANNILVTAKDNENASLKSYQFKDGINSIKGGQYINGDFDQTNQESLELTAEIAVTGAAGNVLNVSDGLFQLQADDSDIFTNHKGSSNLITYQGDLNYDGRVSMKDLAYLNAGAARQIENEDGSVDTASVARDVDADFSGKIDLADLSVLDADWGKTLHTGDEQFQGSADVSWSELDNQGDSSTWDNTSFKDQNAIEAESDYVGSLEAPGTSGVIGSDGNQDGSNSLEGGSSQNDASM